MKERNNSVAIRAITIGKDKRSEKISLEEYKKVIDFKIKALKYRNSIGVKKNCWINYLIKECVGIFVVRVESVMKQWVE